MDKICKKCNDNNKSRDYCRECKMQRAIRDRERGLTRSEGYPDTTKEDNTEELEL